MGGVQIGPWLTGDAERCAPDTAIVELGCWLGAGTAHLALGAMRSGAPIHCYDRWRSSAHEVRKAAAYGVALEVGEDLLPRVRRSLRPFPVAIHYHRGEIAEARWEGGPIGLYVDDASKADLWLHSMAVFSPWFVAGLTRLFLMDFHHTRYVGGDGLTQERWIAERAARFELVASRLADTSCAVFRYLGGA
jgi:hypothetical protein